MSARSRILLDGTWNFIPNLDPIQPAGLPQDLASLPSSQITVPAPWQADPRYRDHLSSAWYQRSFELPPESFQPGRAILLGFGAVDYFAEVWVNHVLVGKHEGGYLPFELDISAAAQAGANVLTVLVDDPPEIFSEIPHGKQSWYGALSGIWQPVWVETRPAEYIRQVKITPAGGIIQVQVSTRGVQPGEHFTAEVFSPDGTSAARAEFNTPIFSIPLASPALWSPEEPNLYTLKVQTAEDEVVETFGFRTIETKNGQIWLNGRPFYMRSALDQDYYPEAICTPPSQEYIEQQFRKAKAMGLNCLRIHIKVGDPRYYAAADKVGLLIWTELPNQIRLTSDAKRRIRETLAGMLERDWNHPSIGIWTIFNESWGIDLTDPAQRTWLAETYHWLKALDPTRLVVDNSACWGNFHVETDLADFHIYYAMPDHHDRWQAWVAGYAQHPGWIYPHEYAGYENWRDFQRHPWRENRNLTLQEGRRGGDEPLIVSEFGNWGLPDVANLKSPNQNEPPWWFENGLEWGEGVVYPHGVEKRFTDYHFDQVFPSLTALSKASQRAQFDALRYEIEQIRRHASIQGYAITEFTDVHWESNGLLDLYRNPKAHFEDLGWLNADDVLIPEWDRQVFTSGERCSIQLSCSHYSHLPIHNAVLQWTLADPSTALLSGELAGIDCPDYNVAGIGEVVFDVPQVDKPTRLEVELRLLVGETLLARSKQEIYVFPAASVLAAAGVGVYAAPEFQAALSALGYRLVSGLSAANVAVVSTLDDACRDFLYRGGKVLFLAELDAALQAYIPGLGLKARDGSPWQGDWASTLGWHRFGELPTGGLVNFAFAGLTPDVVLQGFAARDFAQDVLAGLCVGWLHKPVPTIAKKRLAQGEIYISTFRLAQQLDTNPLAKYLLARLMAGLTGAE